ncbi:hypothetical protein [Pasteurella sp. PK-2025]|uniref:hypothetical protein n=1 Tax=unclassified Pasteurella TaxID=2621516 RepID=UPI003C7383D2
MMLYEIIKNINHYNIEDTIYSEEPWNIYSQSIVINEDEYCDQGYSAKKYFLEVFLVKELLDDLPSESSLEEKCNRIIYYAINDC